MFHTFFWKFVFQEQDFETHRTLWDTLIFYTFKLGHPLFLSPYSICILPYPPLHQTLASYWTSSVIHRNISSSLHKNKLSVSPVQHSTHHVLHHDVVNVIFICFSVSFKSSKLYFLILSHIYIYVYIYTHKHTYTHIHTYTHTYVHMTNTGATVQSSR
jgi:hypothetical protein